MDSFDQILKRVMGSKKLDKGAKSWQKLKI